MAKHPSISACRLNKLLFDLRHKPVMRQQQAEERHRSKAAV
jgi:hypothetical protein